MQSITEPATNEKAVPPPLRKHHFDRAAPFIGEALRNFPRAVAFYPQELTPETFARCLRQGIEAKRRYGYGHDKLDEELWTVHGQHLCIAVRYPITEYQTVNGEYQKVPHQRQPAVIVGGRAEVKAYVL